MVDQLLKRMRGLMVMQKLALLSAMAFAPCALVCAMYFAQAQEQLNFTRREAAGQAYLGAIWPLAASAGLGLSGDHDPRYEHRVAAFEAANAAYASTFGVQTQAALFAEELRTSAQDGSHSHVALERALKLMELIADRSNLVLDPELDSFYAMDLVVNRLPELALAAEHVRHAAEAAPDSRASEMLLAIGRLLPEMTATQESVWRYRLYVEQHEGSPDLATADEQLGFAIEDLSRAASAIAPNADAQALETARVAAFRAQVMADTLWRYSNDELGRLLKQRLQQMERELALAVMIFALSLIGTLVCMVFMARSIVRPQRRLAGAMRALAEGDLQSPVPYRSASSEIGEVARAVEVFRHAMIEREMLAQDLSTERDALEARVGERTEALDHAKTHAEAAFAAMSEALRSANAGMWRHNRKTGEFWSSEAHRAIAGGVESTVKCTHPDDLPKVLEAQSRADKGENGRDLEYRILRRDGEVRWLHGNWHWFNQDEVVGLVIDITARKQHEIAISEAHARAEDARRALSQALETVGAGLWTYTRGDGFPACSPEFSAQFKTPLDAAHHGADGVWTAVHPADRAMVAEGQRNALEGHDGTALDFRILWPDGTERWVSNSWRWVSNDRIVGLLVDITDRKLQEQETIRARRQSEHLHERAEEARGLLAQALATVSAGVWGYNPNTRTVWSSPEIEELFGKPLTPEHLEDGIWSVFHPDDRELVRAALTKDAAAVHRTDFDARFIHGKTGAHGWISLSWRRQPDGGFIGLMMDVTARQEAALELARAREAAEAANAAKSAFLATMSHEIRTPLNGILGMGEGLARTALDTRQTMMLGVIRDAGELLLGVLNDVLDLSQIEAGAMHVERAPLDLPGALQAATSLFQETAAAKGVRLSVDIAPEATGAIMGDALRLRQIVQNLVSNAVKFTDGGSVTVGACVEAENGGGETLVVRVTDTGIGMSPEQVARVFERFSQADAGIARRFGGSGLGLTISRDLARMMGGDIELSSALGVGTTFTLRLPMERVRASGKAEEASTVAGPAGAQNLKLLLVDDNAMNRLVMHTLLDQMELQTAFAENGAEAVAMADAQHFDAIFMDLHMPVMDGITATRAIRSGGGINAQTPIIALSADTMRDQIARCLEAGMNDHIAKPIRPDALFAALGRALDPESESGAALTAATRASGRMSP